MNYTVRWNFVLLTFQSWRPPVNKKSGWLCRWKEGLHAFFSTLKTFRMSQSLQEVFDCFDLDVAGEVVKAEAADRPSGPWRSIDMQETVDVLASFNARHVVFWFARAHEKKTKQNKKTKTWPTDPLWKKLWRATKQFFFFWPHASIFYSC